MLLHVLYAESGDYSDHETEVIGVFDNEKTAEGAILPGDQTYHIAEMKVNEVQCDMAKLSARRRNAKCSCVLCARKQSEISKRAREMQALHEQKQAEMLQQRPVHVEYMKQLRADLIEHIAVVSAAEPRSKYEQQDVLRFLNKLKSSAELYMQDKHESEGVARKQLHATFQQAVGSSTLYLDTIKPRLAARVAAVALW